MSAVAIQNGNVLVGLFDSEELAEAAQQRTFINRTWKADAKGITVRWDVPVLLTAGPHSGKWRIAVPADQSRKSEKHVVSKVVLKEVSDEWAGVTVVEFDPAWLPSEKIE
jgi:hypothetical protein